MSNLITPPEYFLYSSCSQSEVQLILFFLSVFCGIPFGILCEFARAFNRCFSIKKLFRQIEIALLFLIYIFYVQMFCFLLAEGTFRVFYIIGNFIGFILWEFTIGLYLSKIFDGFFVVCKKVACFFVVNRNYFVGYSKITKKQQNKWFSSWKLGSKCCII